MNTDFLGTLKNLSHDEATALARLLLERVAAAKEAGTGVFADQAEAQCDAVPFHIGHIPEVLLFETETILEYGPRANMIEWRNGIKAATEAAIKFQEFVDRTPAGYEEPNNIHHEEYRRVSLEVFAPSHKALTFRNAFMALAFGSFASKGVSRFAGRDYEWARIVNVRMRRSGELTERLELLAALVMAHDTGPHPSWIPEFPISSFGNTNDQQQAYRERVSVYNNATLELYFQEADRIAAHFKPWYVAHPYFSTITNAADSQTQRFPVFLFNAAEIAGSENDWRSIGRIFSEWQDTTTFSEAEKTETEDGDKKGYYTVTPSVLVPGDAPIIPEGYTKGAAIHPAPGGRVERIPVPSSEWDTLLNGIPASLWEARGQAFDILWLEEYPGDPTVWTPMDQTGAAFTRTLRMKPIPGFLWEWNGEIFALLQGPDDPYTAATAIVIVNKEYTLFGDADDLNERNEAIGLTHPFSTFDASLTIHDIAKLVQTAANTALAVVAKPNKIRAGSRLKVNYDPMLKIVTAGPVRAAMALIGGGNFQLSKDGSFIWGQQDQTRVQIAVQDETNFGGIQALAFLAAKGPSIVQTYIALTGLWLQQKPGGKYNDTLHAAATDVLRFMGRKPTTGGGYRSDDILQRGRDIFVLMNTILPTTYTTWEQKGKSKVAKPRADIIRLVDIEGMSIQTTLDPADPGAVVEFKYHLSEEVYGWATGKNKQYSLATSRLLQYNPDRDRYQILLAVALIGHDRINDKFPTDRKLHLPTLLRMADIALPTRNQGRFLQRIAGALKDLHDDGVVRGVALKLPDAMHTKDGARLIKEGVVTFPKITHTTAAELGSDEGQV